jgi:hypothetical protein
MKVETVHEQVKNLLPRIGQLPTERQEFARDLCVKFGRHGQLSTKQVYWLDRLAREAAGEAPKTQETVASLGPVVELFDKAASGKLKWPRITLDESEVGVPLVLSRAGPNAGQPGSVNLTDGGTFGTNVWYGRIERTGTFVPGRDCPETIVTFLQRLAGDAADVAGLYGRRTGKCCACNTPLTDSRSIFVGYGKVCAGHFGWHFPSMKEVHAANAGQRDLLEERAEQAAFARLEREQEHRGFMSDPDQLAA